MSGKYLQFVIPAYKTREDAQSTPANTPSTYLRLGKDATALTSDAAGGDDDLTTTDKTFKADTTPWAQRATKNDVYRDDGATITSSDTASQLTTDLFTRGGVREHTDGNRISTTRGDCVEVVGGNYKLVVLGRVSGENVVPETTTGSGSTWESSGGHNHDSTSTPGEVTSITWVTGDASSGEPATWQVTETTDKGDRYEEFEGGRIEDVFSGTAITSTIGTADGKAADAWMSTTQPNITEKTYARKITSTTKATSVNTTDTIANDKTETVEVKASCGEHFEWTDITAGGSYTETLTAAKFDEELHAGMVFGFERFGVKNDDFSGTWTNNINIHLGVELGVGATVNCHWDRFVLKASLGATFETSMSATASLTIAPVINIKFVHEESEGATYDFDLVNMLWTNVYDQRLEAAADKLSALMISASAQDVRS